MSATRCYPRPGGATSKTKFPRHFLCFLAMLLLALGAGRWSALADGADDDYLAIFNLLDEADTLVAKSNTNLAVAKYREAYNSLLQFKKTHPDYNPKVVTFRINYAAAKVTALTEPPFAPAPSTNVASGCEIKVLESGAEPRKALRIHPKAGDKQSVLVTVKVAVENKLGEAETPGIKLPAMKLPMDVTVKNVSAEGDIAYELVMGEAGVVDEPGLMPQVVDAIKAAFGGLKGLSGSGTVSSRGVSQGTQFKTPAGADAQTVQIMDQLKDSFSNFAMPLPEEPLGAGAKWQVKMPLKSQGINLTQTTTYQLVSLEGDRLAAKTTLTQNASSQKIQSPSMPGLKVDLSKMVGNGTGEFKLDLAQLLPSEGGGNSQSELSMSMNAGGQSQAITTKIQTNVRFEAK
jgi:hypothetical protein